SILAILVLGLVAPAIADDAKPAPASRLRGTIEQVAGDTVTILSHDGKHQAVLIGPNTKISALRQLAIGDIKPGDFIGTAALKETGGHLKALEVTIFAEALRGAGGGQHPLDRGPDSSIYHAAGAVITAGGTRHHAVVQHH